MRARGEGSLTTERRAGRKPRYLARHSLPDGRQKAKRFPFTKQGKVAAVDWLRSQTPASLVTSTSTLGDYLAAWLTAVRATLAPTTWNTYETHCRNHILPGLGSKRLNALTPSEVTAFLHSLTWRRELKGGTTRKASPQTANHIRAILRTALNDAKRDGLIERNPAELAKPPTIPKTERKWLSGDELQTLFDGTAESRFHALWVLAGTTGLRSGELLALGWPDVDLDTRVLRVRHTLHRERGEWVFRPTKTRQERTVPLTEYALRTLRLHRARQQERRLASDDEAYWGLVFTSPVGQPLHRANLSTYLRRDLLGAGLPVVTVHALRHSCASWWLREGVDVKTVSVLLGHTDPRITMSLYLHVGDDLKRDAARRLDEAMG